MNVGSLFSGCGLLDYGLHLAGFKHAWFCERDEFRASILERRWPGVPVYRDVGDVDGRAARVDLVAGGFPCKGVSSAGQQAGFGHPETALWREMLRIVRELRPRYVLVENVADLLVLCRGELFGEVLGGLAESGYDAEWDCFPAAAFGAPHGRDRVFVTAIADTDQLNGRRRAEAGRFSPSAQTGDRPIVDDTDAGAVGRGRVGQRTDDATRSPVADTNGAVRREELHARSGRERQWSLWHDAAGRGVGVKWGRYEAAIRRWEIILGRPAPEPLVRRVDDGRTGRLERSRLSALGDGVLVQAGWLMGRRIIECETGGRGRTGRNGPLPTTSGEPVRPPKSGWRR